MAKRPPTRLVAARFLSRSLPPLFSNRSLRRLYPADVGKRHAYQFVVRSLTGSWFSGRSDDFHARKFGVHGYSEWPLWAIALAVCSADDNIVEAGAHVGTETVGYSDLVAAGTVFAFEPNPAPRQALERTLMLAGIENVTVFPFALGDRAGTIGFALPPPDASSGVGHLLGPEEARTGRIEYLDREIDAEVIEVEVRTLDSMIDLLPTIRLVSLDAEGAELRILSGAEALIERDRPAIVVEAFAAHSARAGTTIDALHAQLTGVGYQVFAIRRLSLIPLETVEVGRIFDNWLCLHESRLDEVEHVRRTLRRCGLLPAIRTVNPLARHGSKRRATAPRAIGPHAGEETAS